MSGLYDHIPEENLVADVPFSYGKPGVPLFLAVCLIAFMVVLLILF